jgi:hypothetical protein
MQGRRGRTNRRTTPKAADGVCDVAREGVGLDLGGKGQDDGPAGVVDGGKREVELRHRFEDGPADTVLMIRENNKQYVARGRTACSQRY